MKRHMVLLLLVIFQLESYQVAGQLPIAISKGEEFLLKGMGEEFVGATFSEFASVAVSFLQDIVKHGLFDLSGKSNDEILKKFSSSLKEIYDQQKQIKADIEKLDSKLSTIVTGGIIADDERKIKDCVDSYECLLQNPDSETYVEQVKQCENIHTEVRSISRILKTKYSFNKISNELGYCNGQYLMKAHNYLFNLYFEGYCILLAAHQLQGKNESHFYINEYKTSLEQIHHSVNEEISACAMEYCKGVPIYSKQISESADNQRTLDLLHKAFPWYRFYMFKLKHGSKYSLKDIKTDVVEFKNQTETADVVLLYVNNIDSKNVSTRGNLNLTVSVSYSTPEEKVCESFKIGVKSDDLMSKAGDDITITERTVEGYKIFSVRSKVTKCTTPEHQRIITCESNSNQISDATSIYINIMQIVVRVIGFVILFSVLT